MAEAEGIGIKCYTSVVCTTGASSRGVEGPAFTFVERRVRVETPSTKEWSSLDSEAIARACCLARAASLSFSGDIVDNCLDVNFPVDIP